MAEFSCGILVFSSSATIYKQVNNSKLKTAYLGRNPYGNTR